MNNIIIDYDRIYFNEFVYSYSIENSDDLEFTFINIREKIENDTIYEELCYTGKESFLNPVSVIFKDTLCNERKCILKRILINIFRNYNLVNLNEIDIIGSYLGNVYSDEVLLIVINEKKNSYYLFDSKNKNRVLLNNHVTESIEKFLNNSIFKRLNKVVIYENDKDITKLKSYSNIDLVLKWDIFKKCLVTETYKKLNESSNVLLSYNENSIRKIHSMFDYRYKYDILFFDNILDNNSNILKNKIKDRECIVFYDQCYNKMINNQLADKIGAYFNNTNRVKVYGLKTSDDGAEKKNQENLNYVLNILCDSNCARNCIIIGIGGGVLLDIVGFAASQYRRMVDYIRIPTTLIGQVDAGIGVKVGINYKDKKNILGAFYPPSSVIIDSNFIYDLDKEKIECGISEIIKMAIINDYKLIKLLQNLNWNNSICGREIKKSYNMSNMFKQIIYQSIVNMMVHLRKDYFERTSLRRLVDFGHTFGPTIESMSNYRISHGYAVAIDMYLSITISYLLNIISKENYLLYTRLIKKYNLLKYIDFISTNSQEIFDTAIVKNIQHRGGNLNFVVPIEPRGNGGFINLESCDSKCEKSYVKILKKQKFRELFNEAIKTLSEVNDYECNVCN